MLPSSPQVQAVYLGAAGVLEALHSPTPSSLVSAEHDCEPKIFIDSTTLDVHIAREVSSQVFAAGAEMVDAPVSGGVVGAKAGSLSFMVGGPETSFDRAKPLLEHMGTRIVHCGDAGNGLIAKLCNNHILVRVTHRNTEFGVGWLSPS
jgi:3-hydroxyisobutyrate dehydrogenase